MFSLLTDAVTLLFSTFIPTFLTYKALSAPPSTQSPNSLHPWLTYWITNSLLLSFPRILPFDSYLRLGAHVYLLIPGRAESIYQTYIRPWLHEHEAAIEEGITNAHDRGKEKVWEVLGSLRDAFAGLLGGGAQAEQQRQNIEARRVQAERERQASGSYVQSLLARWSNESKVEQSAAAGRTQETTLATKFGSIISAAASVGIEHATNAVNAASSHKAQPISTQTHTTSASSAVDGAHARISEGLTNLATGLTDMKKSRSETEFERIEQEDAPSPDILHGKARAGWTGWLWADKSSTSIVHPGSDTATGASSGVDAPGH